LRERECFLGVELESGGDQALPILANWQSLLELAGQLVYSGGLLLFSFWLRTLTSYCKKMSMFPDKRKNKRKINNRKKYPYDNTQ